MNEYRRNKLTSNVLPVVLYLENVNALTIFSMGIEYSRSSIISYIA